VQLKITFDNALNKPFSASGIPDNTIVKSNHFDQMMMAFLNLIKKPEHFLFPE
jgi:hypothetical protein